MERHIVIGVLLAVILLTNATYTSAATLWDFVLKVKLEKPKIELYEKPVVLGTVFDHAGKPVPGADVSIRFADKSAAVTTDSQGNFKYEFGEQQTPGTFSVIVSAKITDKKGFATLTLTVGDEDTTFNEMYYKSSDFANKTKALPSSAYAGMQLKQFQKFLEEQNKRKQKQLDVEAKKLALLEKQNLAQQSLEKAMLERAVGAGVISDKDLLRYLSKVNPKIKDSVSAQLNYTKQVLTEAQSAMKAVLDNGGSLQEAKKAYFDKLSITQDQLNDINSVNNTENHSKIKTNESKKINSKKVKGLSANKNLK